MTLGIIIGVALWAAVNDQAPQGFCDWLVGAP